MQQINEKKNYVKLKVERNENRNHSATNKHDLKEEKCQVGSHQHLTMFANCKRTFLPERIQNRECGNGNNNEVNIR